MRNTTRPGHGSGNSRNSSTGKRLLTEVGGVDLQVPRGSGEARVGGRQVQDDERVDEVARDGGPAVRRSPSDGTSHPIRRAVDPPVTSGGLVIGVGPGCGLWWIHSSSSISGSKA
jgi:hypothetical protein